MKLCDYGCGQEAKYQFKNGKWCCSKYTSKCKNLIKKSREKNIGREVSPETKKKIGTANKGKKRKIEKLNENNSIFCSFGCGNLARYYFKTSETFCCSSNVSKCGKVKERISSKLIGHPVSEKTKQKIGKQIIKTNKTNLEYKINQSLSRKLSIEDYKEKYPFFSKIEEMRYNPDKPGEKEIQVHCKFSECKNSKQSDGWFTPTYIQLYERIRQLEKDYGNDGCYFYCSHECKTDCNLYNLKTNSNKESDIFYEDQIFREEVLRRQKEEYGYNFCEYCGSEKDLQVHHEKTRKTHPLFILDPDNGIVLCKDCHYLIGHPKGSECSTGRLANIVCN